jgi:hypothetical protein
MDFKRPAQSGHSLLHANQAESLRLTAGPETAAIVFDSGRNPLTRRFHGDFDRIRICVPAHIVQGFLHDTEEANFMFIG